MTRSKRTTKHQYCLPNDFGIIRWAKKTTRRQLFLNVAETLVAVRATDVRVYQSLREQAESFFAHVKPERTIIPFDVQRAGFVSERRDLGNFYQLTFGSYVCVLPAPLAVGEWR